MKFQAAARAIPGSKETQEDAWRIYDAAGADAGQIAQSDIGVALSGGGLLLVADGIGGHHGGDVASAITADTFVTRFFGESGDTEARLKKSLTAANNAIADAQQKDPTLKDMGATLVTGFIDGDRMSFLSVGDSLILRYRDGELHRVNDDHSYMEIADREALGSGDRALWRDVMARKGRDSITIAVLGRALEDFGHTPQIATRKILPGDVLIFSSDGLETLSWVQIQNFVRALLPKGVGAVADGLIKAVDGIGGNRNYQDNATLIVLQADGDQPVRAVPPATPVATEAAKTAPTVPLSAAAPSGSISASARSGKWSPAKLLLGVAIGIIAVGAAALATGKFPMMFRDKPPVSTPVASPAPKGEPALRRPLPPGGENEYAPRGDEPKGQVPGRDGPGGLLGPAPRFNDRSEGAIDPRAYENAAHSAPDNRRSPAQYFRYASYEYCE